MIKKIQLMVGAAALLAASAGRAELAWRERRILLQPPAGAEDARGEFVFTNRGAAPVRVIEARSSCECTVLASSDTVVYPGQEGRVPVVFHLEGRSGRQAVGVVVTTSEPEIRHHELTVEVEIREFATFTPRLLHWKVGDEAAGKILQLTLKEGFRLLEARSASDLFVAAVIVQDGERVQLRVTPRDTWARRNGELVLRLAREGNPPVTIRVPLRVI